MKNRSLVLLVLLLLLSGCGSRGAVTERGAAAGGFSFRDGRYVLSGASSDPVPYLLIRNGSYTVVMDIAVSYQPGGKILRDGSKVTFEGKFGNEDYRCAFTLIADDELRFDLGRSNILQSMTGWTDGMVFSISEEFSGGDGAEADGQAGTDRDRTELMERFPEYFGLDTSNGLDVIVGQMSESSYFFALLEHSETLPAGTVIGLMDQKSLSAEQLREILAAYAVSEDSIYIVPWEYSFSSYLPPYLRNSGGGDMEAGKEAYIAEIRKMLFG